VWKVNDNFGDTLEREAPVRVTARGKTCSRQFSATMRISKPGGVVFLSRRMTFPIDENRVHFGIKPVSVITDASGGQRRLYYEILLDDPDQWQESNENDNVRGTWFELP